MSVGIEFETEQLSSNELGRIVDRNVWGVTRDASVETPTVSINKVRFESNGLLKSVLNLRNVGSSNISGGELRSVVLPDESDFNKIFFNLTRALSSNGEQPTGNRSGIHIHIGAERPGKRICIRQIKNYFILGAAMERLFFNIGGMGYSFRGMKNDSIYCRPLTKYGPTVVCTYNGTLAQVMNLKDILASESTEELFERFGDNSEGRYTPIRYMYLNIYALKLYRTIEFRVFNKCLDHNKITAIVKLCQAFNSVCQESPLLKLEERSIYDPYTKEDLYNDLNEFSTLLNLDGDTIATLEKIIKITPLTTLNNKYYFPHLRRVRNDYWKGSSYVPKQIKEEVFSPNFVDIHTITGE